MYLCIYIYIHSIYTPPGVYEDDKDIYTYIKLSIIYIYNIIYEYIYIYIIVV